MTWHRTSRHARGYGAAWDKLRLQILERDHFLCQRCASAGRVREASHCDHRIPRAKGGKDDADNLQSLCPECHRAKSIEDAGGTPRRQFDARGFPIEDAPKRPTIPTLRPRVKKL